MNKFSLRVRLAAASAVGVLIVMALAGALQFRLLSSGAIGRVDDQLQDYANLIEDGARPFETFLTGLGSEVSLVQRLATENGLLVNTINVVNGRLVRADIAGRGEIPITDELQAMDEQFQRGETSYYFTTTIDDVKYRVISQLTGEAGTQRSLLLIARSISDVAAAQATFAVFLIGGTILTVLIAGSLGYVITRQAMRPVRRLAFTANEIARTADLNKRVAEGGQDRDLSNLTETFNEMLDTIETAYGKMSDALDAERRFVANASHELRTPLTTIRGNVDYLARTGVDDDVVADLRGSSERLTALVASLTELAREESGVAVEDKTVDFDELVRDVAAEPAYHIDGVEMHLDIADDVWVRGSEASLASVVRNLLGNAVKYGNGRVDLKVAQTDGWATFEVRDDGPGVPAEDTKRVFERFWRAPDAKPMPGSGLGLSIVRSAVRAHKGEVAAYPGPGGRFVVSLPATASPAGSDADSDAGELPDMDQ